MNKLTNPSNDDPLVNRYREASAQLNETPSPRVRASVLEHAASVAQSNGRALSNATPSPFTNHRAANDGMWRYALAAGVLTASLTALVSYQWRGSQDEPAHAASAPATPATPANAVRQPPAEATVAVANEPPPAPAPAPAAAPATVPAPSAPPAPEVIARAKTEVDKRGTAGALEKQLKLPQPGGDAPGAIARVPAPAPAAAPTPFPQSSGAIVADAARRDADAETSVALLEQKRARTFKESEPPSASNASTSTAKPTITAESAVAAAAPPAASPAPIAAARSTAVAEDTVAAAGMEKRRDAASNVASGAKNEARSAAAAPQVRVGEMPPSMQRGMQIVQANSSLRGAVQAKNAAQVRGALQRGAEVNVSDDAGTSMLIVATRNGSNEIVLDLLSAGADVHRRDAAGMTAIDYARRSGNQALVDALVRAGAR